MAHLLAYDHPDAALDGVQERRGDSVVFSPRDLVEAVAGAFEMTYEEMTGPKREKRYTRPRQIAADILHSPWFNLGMEEIAKLMNRQDHTTIWHYLQGAKRDELFWEVVKEVAVKAGMNDDAARRKIAPRGF